MQHAMTLEELQARLAKDLGPKYKGSKRKVNATLKNLQKVLVKDLKEIEEEDMAVHKDDFEPEEDDFDDDMEENYTYGNYRRYNRKY